MKYKFHQNKVALTEKFKTEKEAKRNMNMIRRIKARPLWKNLSIAKRYNKFLIVGVKRK